MGRAKRALAVIHQCCHRIATLAQQAQQVLLALEQRTERCVVVRGQRLAEQGMQRAVVTV